MKQELADYLNKETTKLKASQRTNRIIKNYPDGICPDCHYKIRADVSEGSECRNCGHVFYSENAN